MKIACFRKSPIRLRSRAFTLVEVLFSSVIALFVSGAVMGLVLVSTRQQRLGFAQARVYKMADNIQDKLTLMLQSASREAGMFFQTADGAMYRTVVFRQGSGPTFPNMSLTFDTTTRNLIYDPSLAVANNNQLVIDSSKSDMAFLESVDFYPGMRVGGIPDSSVVMVVLTVSDRGYGKPNAQSTAVGVKATGSTGVTRISTTRTFAVNLRRQ